MRERCVLTVDLDRLAGNYKKIRAKSGVPVMCVVKADAYGHGAAVIAKNLFPLGAHTFCVATFEEALDLRRAVPACDILVLGYVPPIYANAAADKKITLSVGSCDYARALSEKITGVRCLSVHIAVNSGMNRYGVSDTGTVSKILSMHNLRVCGAYTHLMCADEADDSESARQVSAFLAVTEKLRAAGIPVHISNSAGIYRYGALGCDAVRAGISLFGFCSPGAVPIAELSARVIWTQRIKKGEKVGYGATFTSQRDMDIAAIGIGYADGLLRLYSGGTVLVGGSEARIVGRISMDSAVIALPCGLSVNEGDRVVIYDYDGKNTEKLGKISGLIPYEQLSLIGKRVKRIYK